MNSFRASVEGERSCSVRYPPPIFALEGHEQLDDLFGLQSGYP